MVETRRTAESPVRSPGVQGPAVTFAAVLDTRGGRYEVEESEYGITYRWCAVEVDLCCGCGNEWTLTQEDTICPGCGADQQGVLIRESLFVQRFLTNPERQPWNYEDREPRERIPY